MSKRHLRRQLNLMQVVMLGTAGTIGSEIFVLTGHAAGIAGPATVLAMLFAGILSLSVALNYCELGTTYPYTGGAMTYVREAFGNNILSFLVGSMDCISSTFYAALSALGFAYSLQVIFPEIPIVPVALFVLFFFGALNILGVTNVGNTQVVLGVILISSLLIYIVGGLILPNGFSWSTLIPGGQLFINEQALKNLGGILRTIALIYAAYIGFEVIADDAEEITNPERNIPRGILTSLFLVTVIYSTTAFVALGTLPWTEMAASETALTDTVGRFLPGFGEPLLVVGGMIATLTSVNAAMLSATREGFTLSRDGAWPGIFSKLSRFRTPWVSILFVALCSCLVAIIGEVDFLSFILSSGYLFVLFWASLAMIRLRIKYPDIKRPFKVPFFPLTAYLAAATCVLIIAFSEWKALVFGVAVLGIFAVYYYGRSAWYRFVPAKPKENGLAKHCILVPVSNPDTAEKLIHIASILAQASLDTDICVLKILVTSPRLSPELFQRFSNRLRLRQHELLEKATQFAEERAVPLYTKLATSPDINTGVMNEIDRRNDLGLVLLGWPGQLDMEHLATNVVNDVLIEAKTNVAVYLDRDLKQAKQILVPVSGGPHSRLAIQLAYEIGEAEKSRITFLHILSSELEAEETEDELLQLREIVEEELDLVPAQSRLKVLKSSEVQQGILDETMTGKYDLMILGASEEWTSREYLFGPMDDKLAEKTPCSVLMVRRYEPVAINWLRRQMKRIDPE